MLTFTAHTECVSATEEPPVCNVWIWIRIWIGIGMCRHCVIWVTGMCPMVTPWMLRNLHTHLPKLSGTSSSFYTSWSFYTLVGFRSANCQAISTEANTTQVCHVWRTRRHRKGCDWHSEGIEMLQWNSNLICSFLKVPCQCLPCAVWVESVVDAGVRAVEVCQFCV